MKNKFIKFLESLLSRNIFLIFFFQLEKYAFIALAERNMDIAWPLVAVIALKDVAILTSMGLLKWGEIKTEINIGDDDGDEVK